MKLKNPFRTLTKFELALWLCSLMVVAWSFFVCPNGSVVSLIASLVGVTALIFVAKGYVFGQVLCVFFAILYGIVSFLQQYYGEMITYLGMSAPAAIAAVIAWLRNPSGNGSSVKVRRAMGKKEWLLTCTLTVAVTVGFYFLLGTMNTAALGFSTLSVATSFLASALTFFRSPYYALAYASNDLVLIVLWGLATRRDIAYLPMIFCFVMFLANDFYGFYNWQKMKRLQESMEYI